MSKINWNELIDNISKNVSDEALKVFKEEEEFFKKLATEELMLLLHYVAIGDEKELNVEIYSAMLKQLSDEELLSLKNMSVDNVKAWSNSETKRKEIFDKLVNQVGKIAANTMIKYVVMATI